MSRVIGSMKENVSQDSYPNLLPKWAPDHLLRVMKRMDSGLDQLSDSTHSYYLLDQLREVSSRRPKHISDFSVLSESPPMVSLLMPVSITLTV